MTYVPVVERGATEAVTGFGLTFIVVTNMPQPSAAGSAVGGEWLASGSGSKD
jgi:hypothetical protein